MKRIFNLLLIIVPAFLLSSCGEDAFDVPSLPSQEEIVYDESDLVETSIVMSVKGFGVESSVGSRADEPSSDPEVASDAEKRVKGVWVFQCKDDGGIRKFLIRPRYYTVNQAPNDKYVLDHVMLKPNVSSYIYVVTNVDSNAFSQTALISQAGLMTFDLATQYQQVITEQDEANLAIPMEGCTETAVEVHVQREGHEQIIVPVTRMFGKVMIKVDINEKLNLKLNNINILNVMGRMRVASLQRILGEFDLFDETRLPDSQAPEYDKQFLESLVTPSFGKTADYNGWYTIYLPESLFGESELGVDDSQYKEANAPKNALRIQVGAINSENNESYFRFCSGGNSYNNYNVRRNCVYRVTIKINNAELQAVPSANCFSVKPGELLSFYPYYRIERGGGYDFADYLTPLDEDKRIDKLEIVWQDHHCIGDNSDGSKVWMRQVTTDSSIPVYEQWKVYVQTNQRGNALIAARNSKGEIIWSWHIWVSTNDPSNIGNSMRYTTYPWDETGIHSSTRIDGYQVMRCNLGALDLEPESATDNTNTFGMLYQWGRKDPFPPYKAVAKGIDYQVDPREYVPGYVGVYYGNDDKTPVGMKNTEDESYLFHSLSGNNANNLSNSVRYAIAHPTVFIAGTKKLESESESAIQDTVSYSNRGDWVAKGQSDDKLWGGLDPKGNHKKYEVGKDEKGQAVYIHDNYGNEKSIFDPCPFGWRVSPGDLWLGFTINGRNVDGDMDKTNYNPGKSDARGMYMYMREFRSGEMLYFPTQGTRHGGGGGMRVHSCGNYHNATADFYNRVNILHLHNSAWLYQIFETQFYFYHVKSVAGPIRCVRDTK